MNPLNFLRVHTSLLFTSTLGVAMLINQSMCLADQNIYFGTGSKRGDGIYHSVFDEKTGQLSAPRKVATIKAPSFLATHPTLPIVYSIGQENAKPVVAAYSISTDGNLDRINSIETEETAGSTHIAIHPSGKFLLTAQYSGSSISLFSLNSDGSIKEKRQSIKHIGGSGIVTNRQDAPHPHWVGFSPDGRFALVPDLGLDVAVIYKVNLSSQKLKKHGQLTTVPGGGPRHMRFSIDGEYIHLLNEFSLSVSTYKYDAKAGNGDLVDVTQTLTTAVKSQEDFNSASEIVMHPSNQFAYSANRGHDSVSVFRRTETTGELELLETESIRGAFPRNINLDTSGNWLLAAGQHSNTVSLFSVDSSTGMLQYQTNSTVNIPEPICILPVDK